MGHSNISVFVPHIGCPHMCAFCNQRTITGTEKIPHADDVKRICTQAMNEVKDVSQTEIAFFGGSFTAVPREYMLELLGAAQEFIGNDKFKGIRISTRPDYISTEILDILRDNHVTAIELGAQSMSDVVLKANERGHTVQDVENAAKLIKSYGCFDLGLQMMIGLYKSNRETELETWSKIAALSPKTVRIYPVVILNGTRLGELYKSGEYKPMDFDEVVKICSYLLTEADKLGIDVIKLGLHASEVVEEQMAGQPEVIRDMVKSINTSLKEGKLVPDVPIGLQALFRSSVQPYMISWYTYNPQEIIKKLKVPVLILQGDKDMQVSVKDAELLKQAQPSADYHLIGNMNHLMKTCDTMDQQRQMATYTDPALPLHKDVLILIEKFVSKP